MIKGGRVYRARSRHLNEMVGERVSVDYLNGLGFLERDISSGRLDYVKLPSRVLNHVIQQGFYVGGHQLCLKSILRINTTEMRIVVNAPLR